MCPPCWDSWAAICCSTWWNRCSTRTVRVPSRVARDMMILSVDPSRAGDGELGEGEAERLTALSRRCSREDLMRAFDLLSKAEQEIRAASHPRYYFEMLLLRWMHLRKLVSLVDLLEGG